MGCYTHLESTLPSHRITCLGMNLMRKNETVCSILNRRTVEPRVEERALVNREVEPGWFSVARPTEGTGEVPTWGDQ